MYKCKINIASWSNVGGPDGMDLVTCVEVEVLIRSVMWGLAYYEG
jgi:hypothetical protein